METCCCEHYPYTGPIPEIAIKPCPFCGDTPDPVKGGPIQVYPGWGCCSSDAWRVWCPMCHIEGPAGFDAKTAIECWNARAPVAPAAGERSEFAPILDALVARGLITQAQADAAAVHPALQPTA